MYHFAIKAEAHVDMFSDNNPSVVCESTAASTIKADNTLYYILYTHQLLYELMFIVQYLYLHD